MTGAVFAATVWFVDRFGVDRIREVFGQISPQLIDFLTLGKGVPGGLPLLAGLCVLSGGVGAFASTAPVRVRAPVSVGVLAVLLLGLLQRIVPIVLLELGVEADWLYSPVTGGLTWLGGMGVFAAAAAGNILWKRGAGEPASASGALCGQRQPRGWGYRSGYSASCSSSRCCSAR